MTANADRLGLLPCEFARPAMCGAEAGRICGFVPFRPMVGAAGELPGDCLETFLQRGQLIIASSNSRLELSAVQSVAHASRHPLLLVQHISTAQGPSQHVSSCYMQVDLDLGKERHGARVCRKQAQLDLKPDGRWRLTNTGRRCVHVNGNPCCQGQSVRLHHLSLVQVRLHTMIC